MSLLLDALRKSERQRRLGRAPSIEISVNGQDRPAGGRWLSPARVALLVAGLCVLLLAGAVWWWRMAPDPADSRQNPATAAPSPTQSRGGDEGAPDDDTGASADTGFRVPAPRQTLPPAPADSGGGATPATASAGRQPKTAAPGGSLDKELPSALNQAPPGPQDAPAPATELAAAREANTPSAASLDEPVDPAPAGEQAAAGERDWSPGAPQPISYYELPVSVRQSLPGFKVTIRVYDANPENRFVIIDRERYFEGDEIAAGLKLLEIRRESLVLEYQQYRFEFRQRP